MSGFVLEFRKIGVALLLGFGAYLLALTLFDATQSRLIGAIVLLVTMWTNEALPLGVVSLLPIVLFPALGIIDTKTTTVNYAHPIIYLFLGGFLLSIAVEKTKLHIYIADNILNFFPQTPKAMIFSLALTSALLSSILSNTTTTLLLISIAIFITENTQLKMRFALAIAYGASIGGILTPIGTPPNLILLGVMQEHNMEMLPVIYSVAEQSGINTTLFMMVATLCASYAFMLPIATPPNAIAMSSGVVRVGNMIRYGFVLNLLGIFFIVLLAEYFWKAIL